MSSPAAFASNGSAAAAPVRQRGAYALVRDADARVLVVQAQNGRFYLPGGRIEPGESPVAALCREMAEECGWACEVLEALCVREQPIFGGRVQLEASYWRVRLTQRLASPAEHEMLWLSPADAARRLHRTADHAAVRGA